VSERAGSGGPFDLVLAIEGAAGTWTEQIVRVAAGSGPLDGRVRTERGHTWVEWNVSASRLGWSEWSDGGWSRSGTVAVGGSTWKARQLAREEVRDHVLGP